jgi:HSP20 family protein|tara:strand:+ start:807 stop:1238 length:432 start_codon:yes stop_codon:yes gene_type:complete
MGNLLARRTFTDPFDDFMKDLFPTSLFTDSRLPRLSNRSLEPVADVYETDDSHVAELAVPGLQKENLSARLENRVLTVSYSSGGTSEEKNSRRHHFSSFTRSWTVPEGTTAKSVNAEYKDGILTISVKKPEVERIPVQTIDIK